MLLSNLDLLGLFSHKVGKSLFSGNCTNIQHHENSCYPHESIVRISTHQCSIVFPLQFILKTINMMTKKKFLAETKVKRVQKIERGRKKQIQKQLIYIKRILDKYLSTWWVLIVYEMTYQEGNKIQLVAIIISRVILKRCTDVPHELIWALSDKLLKKLSSD